MNNEEKLFELMTQMYSEMQKRFTQVYSEMQKGFTQVYSEMQKGFTDLGDRIDKVENRLDGVESRLDKVESRLDRVEKTVVHIENDHGQKLSALFDGYKQNSDKLDRIETEVSKHEEIILRRVR
ncbi:hypothetical protein [Tepidibacillus decaturensis]|uniref:t-SNARE coiled-coil homology domain-containing protein n=1 Tax=Tepidibacillus decaturensis TaxID=1413211 RepID=A0A135L5E5_9BACI|nr:hypothetical protein [Tepidibacillus decaturensis]KXG44232.1 hypothetical protein U473_09625 [Tepidibacillus decaturensis]